MWYKCICVIYIQCACSIVSNSDSMDCSLPGSSVHGIFQAKYLSGLLFPTPWNIFPSQELKLGLLHLLHCRQVLYCWAIGKTYNTHILHVYIYEYHDINVGWISEIKDWRKKGNRKEHKRKIRKILTGESKQHNLLSMQGNALRLFHFICA